MSENTPSSKLKNRKIIAGIILGCVVIAAVLIPILINSTKNNGKVTLVTVNIANIMINNDDDYPDLVVLDVRNESEWATEHINNSINIPYFDLEDRIDELSSYKHTEIVVHCRVIRRSTIASDLLVEKGFTKIFKMDGGINEWKAYGFPTITEEE